MEHIEDTLAKLRDGFASVQSALDTIARKPAEKPVFLNNEISGDKIHGGTITKFASVGIEDQSHKKILIVGDDGIHIDAVHTSVILPKGKLRVDGNLEVHGQITAEKLHVNEISADIRNERTSPLEFIADEKGIYGKGLQWKGAGPTKQFVYRANDDRLWSSETIDLADGQSYRIGNTTVLTKEELGSSVRYSNLIKVGTLQSLRTSGNLAIDDYIIYNSDSQRLGFGTESPNGSISVTSLESEFIIDVEGVTTRIGNYTTDDLEIVTDNTTRIKVTANGQIQLGRQGRSDAKVNVYGQLGIGITNVKEGVSLATVGPVQIQNKTFEVGSAIPTTGVYSKGDIVWNDNPQPSGYVGWICIREGTPGEWRPFGAISK